MLDRGVGARIYTAEEDCYLWMVEGEDRHRWFAEPAISRWVIFSLHDSQVRLRVAAAELIRARQHSDKALAMPARSVGAADVVYVTPVQSIGEVAVLMEHHRIGSVLVGDGDHVG